MSSFLDKEGIYTPGKRFAFTNISTSKFTSKWNGIPVSVEPGEAIEVSDTTPFPGSGMGECLALKLTRELTDQIMLGQAAAPSLAEKDPTYSSPLGHLVGVPAARKPVEDAILSELGDEDSLAKRILEKQKADELINDANRKEGVSYENPTPGAQEFANIPNGPTMVAPAAPKPAARTKRVSK